MSDSVLFRHYSRIQISRAAIGIVLFLNLQCAIQFLISPADYAAGFELLGFPGTVSIRGMAILFLMWNVPYCFALVNPQDYRVSYLQALIMQFIGLIGETLLWSSLPGGHNILNASLLRFILFDTAGLVLIIFGLLLIPHEKPDKLLSMVNRNQ
jgi:hypothetical protein